LKRYLLVTTIVVAMVLSMVGSAFAFSDVADDADYASDFGMLEEVGVYQGYPDGTAKPGNALTRAEFAAIIVRALDKEDVAEAVASYETSFTDDAAIADWARGYVIVASSLGIINGYPDGSFKPANNVTYAEAIAMLARALKVDEAATGSWPTNYLVLGADIGLTDGVDPIANLPITRGEMATMTANAMLSTWYWDSEEEELAQPDPDDGTQCLLYDLDDDVWGDYGETDVAGVITDYLPSSGRIKVGGEYYYLADDVVDLVVNDADPVDFDFADFDTTGLFEDDEVVLTLNSDDEVTAVEVTRDTYADLFLEDVATDEDETYFGSITVDGDVLDVDDDSTLLLDGEDVNLAELEDAWDAFGDDYGVDPLVTVRTEGDVDAATGAYVIYASVITANTVEGEITAAGNDGDPYIRLDGEKVYYDDVLLQVGDELVMGNTVTLLLSSDDEAMVVLEAFAEEDHYFGKVIEYTIDEGLDSVTVVLADGTEVTLNSFVEDDEALVKDSLNEILEVDIDTSGDADFVVPVVDVGPALYEDHSSTWIQVNDAKYVRDADLFVYDGSDYIDLDDLETTNAIALYQIDGVVGYVEATGDIEEVSFDFIEPAFDNTNPPIHAAPPQYAYKVLRMETTDLPATADVRITIEDASSNRVVEYFRWDDDADTTDMWSSEAYTGLFYGPDGFKSYVSLEWDYRDWEGAVVGPGPNFDEDADSYDADDWTAKNIDNTSIVPAGDYTVTVTIEYLNGVTTQLTHTLTVTEAMRTDAQQP